MEVRAGIRESSVNGVQTFALPISGAPTISDSATVSGAYYATGNIVFTVTGPGGFTKTVTDALTGDGNGTYTASATLNATGQVAGTYTRSEERRVGKESRSRWSPYH